MPHLDQRLASNAACTVSTYSGIRRLDEGGFTLSPILLGLRFPGVAIARMDYAFTQIGNTTLYQNTLTMGFNGWLARLCNPFIRRYVFNTVRGRAWVNQNVEAVRNFESFLPEIYRSHHRSSP